MIIPGHLLAIYGVVHPFRERTVHNGMTYGVGPAGYDVRIAETVRLRPGEFSLASTVEEFHLRDDLVGFVHDKSTWARRGLSLFNTVLEPSWRGFLTLELANMGPNTIDIEAGSPIAQIIFMKTVEPTLLPYRGKYQNQKSGPQAAIVEKSNA